MHPVCNWSSVLSQSLTEPTPSFRIMLLRRFFVPLVTHHWTSLGCRACRRIFALGTGLGPRGNLRSPHRLQEGQLRRGSLFFSRAMVMVSCVPENGVLVFTAVVTRYLMHDLLRTGRDVCWTLVSFCMHARRGPRVSYFPSRDGSPAIERLPYILLSARTPYIGWFVLCLMPSALPHRSCFVA